MKKFLQIIAVILLFSISFIMFWIALFPKNFSQFFKLYPVVSQTVSQTGIFNPQVEKILKATSSEPVMGLSGQIIIGNNTWNVEIAKNDSARITGLSSRKTLYSKKGMLFVFTDMSYRSFWMKDMFFPIDMIFFDDNWRIVLIESNLQPNTFPKIFGDTIKSQYMLEVGGLESSIYDLKVGDQAIFLNK